MKNLVIGCESGPALILDGNRLFQMAGNKRHRIGLAESIRVYREIEQFADKHFLLTESGDGLIRWLGMLEKALATAPMSE